MRVTDMTVRYAGRARDDDLVHAVDADASALLDPAPFSTRCGQPVLEVYNSGPEVTCPDCGATVK